MSSIETLPVISVPNVLAERIKKFGSLDFEPSDVKEILDAAFNYILAETSEGRSVMIPKAFKFGRKLLEQRTFRYPNNQSGQLTTTKPARYSLNLSVMAAAKIAFEGLTVTDDEVAGEKVAKGKKVVKSDEEENDEESEQLDELKPVKGNKAPNKAKASKKAKPEAKPEIEPEIVPASDSEVAPVTKAKKGKSTKTKPVAESDVEPEPPVAEPVAEPVKAAKKPKSPKADKADKPSSKKGGESKSSKAKSSKVDKAHVEMVNEPYDEIDGMSDEL